MSMGRAALITVTSFLVISIVYQGALCETPPSHENFEEAERNLEILLSFLEDSKLLCEETLSYFVNMNFSPENFNIAMVKAGKFHKSLLEMETLLKDLKGEASSYNDLKEYLTPFQNLDLNTTNFIKYYNYFFENRTDVEDFFNGTVIGNITVDKALQSLNNTEVNIDLLKNILDGIKFNTDVINQKGFSTIRLEELINKSRQIIESGENTTKELSELFIGIPSFLSIYVNKTKFALGDELTIYGYFFWEGSFKSEQNINVFMDGHILGEVFTNNTGRYKIKKNIPLNHTLGKFEIYSSTIYNYIPMVSNRINITVDKVPTKLTLSTPFSAYSPNQSIPFSGRLVDYRGQGLQNKNITFYFNDTLGKEYYFRNITITNISTDFMGNYDFMLNTTDIPLGAYLAKAKLDSDDIYIGSISKKINISINIPTNLILSILETIVYEGENITFSGQLIDELDNISISNMTIKIFIEDEKVGEVFTNISGRYEYVYSTYGMAIGKYNVHSKFNPTEVKWREAVSDTIEIEIKEPEEPTQGISLIEKIFDNLLLIVLLIFIFLFPSIIYKKKERLFPQPPRQTQRTGKKLVRKGISQVALTEKELKEIKDLDNKLITLNEIKNFREAIIAKYHTLLSILEKNKIIKVKPSDTHLDIQRKLTDEGFPMIDIQSITKIFENAMYSNHPIDANTLEEFNISAKKIFVQTRRSKG